MIRQEGMKIWRKTIFWGIIGLVINIIMFLLAAMAIESQIRPYLDDIVVIASSAIPKYTFVFIWGIFTYFQAWMISNKNKQNITFNLRDIVDESQANRYIDMIQKRREEIVKNKAFEKEKELKTKTEIKSLRNQVKCIEDWVFTPGFRETMLDIMKARREKKKKEVGK